MIRNLLARIETAWRDNNMSWRKLVLIAAALFAVGGMIPFCVTIVAAWIEVLGR